MMMFRTLIFLPAMAVLLGACGGGGGGGGSSTTLAEPPIPDPGPLVTGLLVQADNEEQLLESVRSGFRRVITTNAEAVQLEEGIDTGAPVQDGAGGQFSTTYTQETSVDEHDIVKYDGRHLFIAPSRSQACCFALAEPVLDGIATDELFAPQPESGPRRIRIVATDPEHGSATEVGVIPLTGSQSVEGLYIENDRLAAVSTTAWWGYFGADFEHVENWSGQTMGLQIYDVADVAAPVLSWDMEVEGAFVNSRKVGNTVYLVTRFTPALPELIYYPLNADQQEENQQLLDGLTVEQLIPRLRVNGQESRLFESQDCYLMDAENALAPPQRGYPTLTAIIAIDTVNPGIVDSVCYDEAASGTYVSSTGIHLTQSDYNDGMTPQTLVHRFALTDGLAYEGSAKVSGDLRTGGNLDFRISEYEGHLRLVTTTWTSDEEDRFEHQLHVLQPSPATLELETLATLPNDANPEPIGKPNEDLYGVRFLGDRAYLVTFERIDPLYVIDLSDPTAPVIAGELEVTGFSDFLHPVSNSLLLGLGQDEVGLVKLELFDVSMPADPTSLGSISLFEGADWSWSEARYDRHAFTYLADVDGVDRFSVPVSANYFDAEEELGWEERLYLFEIQDKADPASASLEEVGYIRAIPQPEHYYDSGPNRAVFHDDAVYYINGESVWSALWSNPFNQVGPQ